MSSGNAVPPKPSAPPRGVLKSDIRPRSPRDGIPLKPTNFGIPSGRNPIKGGVEPTCPKAPDAFPPSCTMAHTNGEHTKPNGAFVPERPSSSSSHVPGKKEQGVPTRLSDAPPRSDRSASLMQSNTPEKPTSVPVRESDAPGLPSHAPAASRDAPRLSSNDTPVRPNEAPATLSQGPEKSSGVPARPSDAPARPSSAFGKPSDAPQQHSDAGGRQRNAPEKPRVMPGRPSSAPTPHGTAPHRPSDAPGGRGAPGRPAEAYCGGNDVLAKPNDAPARSANAPERPRGKTERRDGASGGSRSAPDRPRDPPARPRDTPARPTDAPARPYNAPGMAFPQPTTGHLGATPAPHEASDAPARQRNAPSRPPDAPPRPSNAPYATPPLADAPDARPALHTPSGALARRPDAPLRPNNAPPHNSPTSSGVGPAQPKTAVGMPENPPTTQDAPVGREDPRQEPRGDGADRMFVPAPPTGLPSLPSHNLSVVKRPVNGKAAHAEDDWERYLSSESEADGATGTKTHVGAHAQRPTLATAKENGARKADADFGSSSDDEEMDTARQGRDLALLASRDAMTNSHISQLDRDLQMSLDHVAAQVLQDHELAEKLQNDEERRKFDLTEKSAPYSNSAASVAALASSTDHAEDRAEAESASSSPLPVGSPMPVARSKTSGGLLQRFFKRSPSNLVQGAPLAPPEKLPFGALALCSSSGIEVTKIGTNGKPYLRRLLFHQGERSVQVLGGKNPIWMLCADITVFLDSSNEELKKFGVGGESRRTVIFQTAERCYSFLCTSVDDANLVGKTAAFFGKPIGPQELVEATTYPDGSVYTGDTQDGHWHGFGRLAVNTGAVYESQWVNDKREGPGRETHPDGTTFDGLYQNGQRHGDGIMMWADGSKYIGQFANGQASGHGSLTRADGSHYKGTFASDCMHGTGVMTWPDGVTYSGQFLYNKRQGYGSMEWTAGKWRQYVGEWNDGMQHGAGTLVAHNGSQHAGTFKDGKLERWKGVKDEE